MVKARPRAQDGRLRRPAPWQVLQAGGSQPGNLGEQQVEVFGRPGSEPQAEFEAEPAFQHPPWVTRQPGQHPLEDVTVRTRCGETPSWAEMLRSRWLRLTSRGSLIDGHPRQRPFEAQGGAVGGVCGRPQQPAPRREAEP